MVRKSKQTSEVKPNLGTDCTINFQNQEFSLPSGKPHGGGMS